MEDSLAKVAENKLTQASVLEALSKVMDPELGKDLVSLNMIKDIQIDGTKVAFRLVLTTPACPLRKELTDNSRNAVLAIPGVKEVAIGVAAEVPQDAGSASKERRRSVKNTIAVASGK